MNEDGRSKLESLREDFHQASDAQFQHFYCPFLYADEAVELCKAHIINKAFHGVSRSWTVQRADVDSFYGSTFEADFVLMEVGSDVSAVDVFSSSTLRRAVKPAVYLDGKRVGHFLPQGDVPPQFTRVELSQHGRAIRLAVKMSEAELRASAHGNWELDYRKHLGLPAFVSTLKAAHLTLFDLFGYQYALTAVGHMIGHDILGSFFLQNTGQAKADCFANAKVAFRDFRDTAKPVESSRPDLQGSIVDRKFLAIHGTSGQTWGLIVFIRTGRNLYATLLPSSGDAIPIYLDFLRSDHERIVGTIVQYDPQKMEWVGGQDRVTMLWPKGTALLD